MNKDLNKNVSKNLKKEQKNKEKKKRKGSKYKEYTIVSYLFVGIFVALIGWVIYFNAIKSEEFLNSPYNKRQDSYANSIVRGSILSADGQILAQTQTDEAGNENRVYPYEAYFAHVVGYTSQGKTGLESLMNYELLSSHAFILEKMFYEVQETKNQGDNVITTLNTNLQMTAYNALGDFNGAVVVMEPSTGKILAMVSKPSFNPNTLTQDWEGIISNENNSMLVNRATQGLYPPGSTFKIVTALTYFREHGSFDGFAFDCVGEIDPGDGNIIHCYNSIVHGLQDLPAAFSNSCNSAFAQIGLDLGANKLRSTSESLLFNQELPIELEYKKSSFSLNEGMGNAYTMLTAIGQGDTLVTPMHMAMIVSAIANGGNLMKPYLVDSIQNYRQDEVTKTMPESYQRLMSPEEAAAVSSLMQQVVSLGTASELSGLSYSAAGKTGSAEYYSNGEMHTHSWFVGYSNVENPDIVVSVIAEDGGAGSSVAVPAAKIIFDAYYGG